MSSKVVGEAKKRAYDNLYNRLGANEGEKDIFKIAKARKRKTRDLRHVKCVKDNDEDERVLMQDKAIFDRWKDYFRNLLNGTHVGELNLE